MPGKLHTLFSIGLIIFLLSSLMMACTPSAPEEPVPATGQADLPIEMMDQAGRLVKLNEMPEKIISLAPSNTEILYALGLEDRLVGVTEYCDYPEVAKQKPKIGGFSTVDIEKVVDIEPDLILATNIHQDEIVPQLERLGLTVVVINPKTVAEVLEAINLVGQLTGKTEEASRLTTEMENRIQAVTDKTAGIPRAQRPRVFYLLWHDPLMTVGPVTRIHELIEKAGGVNIAQDLADEYPRISMEATIMANPQVIIAGSGHGSSQDVPFSYALTEPRLAEVAARQDGRVYEIDSDLTSRPGARIVDGLEKLAGFINPELFEKPK